MHGVIDCVAAHPYWTVFLILLFWSNVLWGDQTNIVQRLNLMLFGARIGWERRRRILALAVARGVSVEQVMDSMLDVYEQAGAAEGKHEDFGR